MDWKKWLISLLLLIVIGSVILFGGIDLLFSNDIELFYEKIHGGIFFVLLLTLSLMIVQNLLTVFPVVILVLLNQWLFDFWLGFFWSWAGTVIGSIIVFMFSKNWFNSLIKNKRIQELFTRIRRHGIMAVFIARLIPIFPSNLINIASGLSGIGLREFFIGTIFGNMIFVFILSLIGTGFVEENNQQFLYWGLVLVVLMAWGAYVYWKKGFKRKEQAQE
ncbi:TVP38/TMEM64 family protein [Bacillus horti]|uniref:TVP38/TMEM64 family membrane protein n=1 Tax=Caldalkalibacillus horti TaxID=77523 RepID=A0ABT9VYF4_9BACI|nr:VTT domain-containing protein [Bacillus horti]MDQ0166029.1 putative membrane protein YdjX (TVP38/TMEM64 family) [Bacillus horti]